MSRVNSFLVLATVLSLALLINCGGDNKSGGDSSSDQTEATGAAVASSEADSDDVWTQRAAGLDDEASQMFESLNAAIVRLRFGDRSGLYDNEFEYMRDESEFSDYRVFQQVSFLTADSIEWIEVANYEYRGENQAIVNVIVHFLGPTGERSEYPDVVRMFRHKGTWIKPSVSVWPNQEEYEKIIREAEEAARREAGK